MVTRFPTTTGGRCALVLTCLIAALPAVAEAVHRMSGLSAEHMGIDDRGLVREGMKADLVLFDPETVIDRATPDEPGRLSDGIASVWVNGRQVYDAREATGARPGVVIRRW